MSEIISGRTIAWEMLKASVETKRFFVDDINYLMPQKEEFLIIPRKEAEHVLKNNPNFQLINLFQLHQLAEEIRYGIAEKIESPHLVQKHGLVPVSDFIQMKPKSSSIIIYLPGNSYFTSINLFKSYPETMGVSSKMSKSELVTLDHISQKSRIVIPKTDVKQHIYETFDGIHFRELKTSEKNINLLSEIALGYNNKMQYKKTLIPEPTYPGQADIIIQRYRDMLKKIKIENFIEEKEQIIMQLINLISDVEFDRSDKFLLREYRVGIHLEMRKLENYITKAKDMKEFREEVLSNQKNFILRFLKKIKIYEHTKKISR